MARTGQTLRRRTTQAIGERSGSSGPSTPKGSGAGARLRYAFDNTMARGTPALVAWLFVVTVLLVLVFAIIDVVSGIRDQDLGFWDASFQALMHALDPGTVAGDTGSWSFRLTMLALTIAGLFIVSALIGVIAAGIDARIADLRRGRSAVLERDHTVILGWADSIYTIVSELSVANESRRRPVIVILADRDKVEMEEEIRAKVPDLRGTRVVCRSGSPTDLDDLAIASPAAARSVVVLSPEGGGAGDDFDPDREVIKTLLALRAADADGTGPRVVAQLRDPANLEVAQLIGRDRAGHTSLLDIRETVAKLVVQTSRQSGAAAVYRELFDYDGDEIYFLRGHALAEATYADALLHYETVTVIGVADEAGVELNPTPGTVIGPRALVVVAEDDSVLETAARSTQQVRTDAFAELHVDEPRPTHTVVIGWNERGPIVVRELDRYAPPGSTLTVLTSHGHPDSQTMATTNLAVTVVEASSTERAVLDVQVPADVDQVIVLCYSDHLPTEAADGTTLVTLLHVRDILARAGSSAPVVSEMIDDRNRALAQVADIDDVVVSGEIVSLLVSQLSEDARIEPVLRELLGAEGSEIYLRPAEWYVLPGAELTWATVVAAASARGESAIGFSSPGLAEPGGRFGVMVNPAKSESLVVGEGDRVVVLARD